MNPENINILSPHKWFALVVMAVFSVLATSTWAAYTCTGEFGCTGFTNIGSIANTRHNMTQSTATPNSTPDVSLRMDGHRNNYGEVCVYCHTPHGSQTLPQMPLWNRTVKATTFTTYNSSSLTQTVSQPGGASLTCLSCHDGQTAIDSIINMPGSGGYLASQATTLNGPFLAAWTNASVQDAWCHASLSGGGLCGQGCLTCHGALPMNPVDPLNFKIFITGTDLTNDHPVGITFPVSNGPGTDFNTPAGVKGTSLYFEVNGNGHMDTDEVRLYDTGGAVKVECASCHDPHGVPSAGPGTQFKPSFLRVSSATTGSALCLTCHDK